MKNKDIAKKFLLCTAVYSLLAFTASSAMVENILAAANKTITVTTDKYLIDKPAAGECTLYDAIQAANKGYPHGECKTGDSIEFAPNIKEIKILNLPIEIVKPLTIDGVHKTIGGFKVRLTGHQYGSVMFKVPAGVTLTLRNLILAEGGQKSGPSIMNEGNLVIDNCELESNRGYTVIENKGELLVNKSIFAYNHNKSNTIDNSGNLIISESRFRDNIASAIGNKGKATIDGSLFHGNISPLGRGGALINSSGSEAIIANSRFVANNVFSKDPKKELIGGAIFNSGGTLEIMGTSIVGNGRVQITTYFPETGVAKKGAEYGGALANSYDGKVTIVNSTISANSNDGSCVKGCALYNYKGKMKINNSTIVDNGGTPDGAIYNVGPSDIKPPLYWAGGSYGDIEISNSIISSNQNITGGKSANCAGEKIIDKGNNIQFPGTDCGTTIKSDKPEIKAVYEGGHLQYYSLLDGSPAIDAGDNGTCDPESQNNVSRPQDGKGSGISICDIGSVEMPARIRLKQPAKKAAPAPWMKPTLPPKLPNLQ